MMTPDQLHTSTPATTPARTLAQSVEVLSPADLATVTERRWTGVALAWLADVQARTGSVRTPAEYRRYLELFLAWLAGDGRTLDGATYADVQGFVHGRLPHVRTGALGRAPGASAVSVRLAALRSFFDFARRSGLVDVNPATDVQRPRLPQPIPRGLSQAEVRALFATIPDSASGRRDRAIILLAVLTGLRRAELLAVTRQAITVDGGIPYLSWRAKGGKLRRRELPRPAFEAITDYLAAANRPLDGLAADAVIFTVTGSTFAANLRRYGTRIGREDVTIHTLRHTAAKLRKQSGASLEDVQAVLGHSSIATTARYLAQLDDPRDHGWQAVAGLLAD